MKKFIILVHDLYQDLELHYPAIRLKEAGVEVLFAGEEKGKLYKGKYGYPCISDIAFKMVNTKQFVGLAIPGGYAPDLLRQIPDVLHLVRNMDEEKKIIAFICHGGWVPISANILRGKRVTGWKAIKDDIENAGGIWHDEPVVIDGHLISSRTPADLPQFGKAIVDAIA
jgi:protease I